MPVELVGSAIFVALALVALDGLDGQVIWVNPEEIVSFRAILPDNKHHFAKPVSCVLQTADGKLINVVNDCDEVRERIGRAMR